MQLSSIASSSESPLSSTTSRTHLQSELLPTLPLSASSRPLSPMAPAKLELTLMAAEGLKNVALLRGKMNPFAVAFVDPLNKHSTRVLHKGGVDPVWNDCMELPVEDRVLHDPNSSLVVQIFNQGSFGRITLVGTARLMLHDLLRHKAMQGTDEADVLILQLCRPSGRSYGVVWVYLRLTRESLNLNSVAGSQASSSDGWQVLPPLSNTTVTGVPVMSFRPHSYFHPIIGSSRGHAPSLSPPVFSSSFYLSPQRSLSQIASQHMKNIHFLLGLVSGAVAAFLLSAIF